MLLCLRAEACDHEAHVARLVDEIVLVRASWGARVLDWEDERGDCFSGQRRARDRGDRADHARCQQRFDDASSQREQHDRGGDEDRELPRFAQCCGGRDRRA